ncbi:hypothetical protein P7H41_11845 [Vagococcus fluvialis]|uniref:hypothetical protein n=1 Tax=Vagococcus fluvialis TaxID=2738 RepID=UPI00288D1C91|nr:hypothetical protein [Vagococcus fluvialis]MDT2782647.1 hypothetical protein [Vagococcus fluvialis]
MRENIWNELNLIRFTCEKHEIMDMLLVKLKPYIKKCASNSYQKSQMYNLSIPYEDFYSNALLEVWDGLIAVIDDKKLNLKNVVIYRINLSEKKTWQQYKKRGNNTDSDQTTYNSVRWSEINFDIFSTYDYEKSIIQREVLRESIEYYCKINKKNSEIIGLINEGYSPRESLKIIYGVNTYESKDRKRIQRIRKEFKEIYNYFNT